MTKEEAKEIILTVRAYYASLTAGYPKGKDVVAFGEYMCSEVANACLMAVKALEQEPCEDCISLNELDKIITKAIDDSENQTECQTLRWVLDVMSELSSVTPQQTRWIPVSERLPEDEQECLITSKGLGEFHIDIATYSTNLYKVDKYDFHTKKDVSGFYGIDTEYGYYEWSDVVAWMPLPQPYEGDKEGADDEH